MESRTVLMPVKLANGITAYVEARSLGGEEDVADRILTFEGVSDAIKGISESISGALIAVRSDKATVEFGLQVAIDSGKLTALLVKGNASASLKITLEWGDVAPQKQ